MDGEYQYSTEGDLDPDLTEEAGYAYWEAPDRSWMTIAMRVLGLLIAISIVLGALLALRS